MILSLYGTNDALFIDIAECLGTFLVEERERVEADRLSAWIAKHKFTIVLYDVTDSCVHLHVFIDKFFVFFIPVNDRAEFMPQLFCIVQITIAWTSRVVLTLNVVHGLKMILVVDIRQKGSTIAWLGFFQSSEIWAATVH